YAPNYYPLTSNPPRSIQKPMPDPIKIGCFGSIRPLKNQLVQAIAAIRVAYSVGRGLEFHINGSRIEGQAQPIMKNLIQLFAGMPRAVLVQHPWLSHAAF